MSRFKLPALVHNVVSYVGTTIAGLAFTAIVFLLIFTTLAPSRPAPYASLVIFVALPAVMIFGLLLIPIGMGIEWRHVRRTGRRSIPRFPVLDFNQAAQFNAFLIFVVVTVILLFLSVFGSYQAFEATESVAFCGTTCHTVMEPEYVTYKNSPHARVRCVDCHVGAGAGWYIRSKISGLYQVYAVTFDKYPRPIPGTIAELRPAQETCEQCHWPAKFFGSQQKRIVHYLNNEENTAWEIRLLLKVGGMEAFGQQGHGIHWHMNIANRIEYIAADEERQQIPWVRVVNKATGESTEYVSTDNPPSADLLATGERRTMDCMDCHNRPSHILRSPNQAMDQAIQAGDIDPTLPAIKQTGVALLKAEYETVPAALTAIETGITAYYNDNHPEVLAKRGGDVKSAIAAMKTIYRKNFFPEMKARWDVYPNNIGHMNFSGCFRCHDGSHKAPDGKLIDTSCTACHVISGQGKVDQMQFSSEPDGLPFEHPEDIGDMMETMKCVDCHATD